MVRLQSFLMHAMSKLLFLFFFLFKNGADLKMKSFSCKKS